MKKQILVLLLSTFTLLAGCSTVSKTECLGSDWEQIGLDDGKRGIAADNDSSYLNSCSDSTVNVDMNAYNLGHEKGVALFCQAENGFGLGEQAYQFTVSCPTEFNDEYKLGYQFYVANNNINQVQKAITTNDTNISKLEARISRANIQLTSDELSATEETALRQDIEAMESQIKGHKDNNVRLEPAIHQLRQQLENLKLQHGR